MEGLVHLAAGGALPLILPHLSFPRLGCWVCRETRRRQPGPLCVPGLVRNQLGPRELPGARITEGRVRGDEAERSEDPVRLKSPAHWPVFSVPISPDHTAAERYAIRKCAGPSFEFRIDCLPISRISLSAPDHNHLLSSNISNLQCAM